WHTQGIIGLILFLLCVFHSSIHTSNNSQVNKLILTVSLVDESTLIEDGGARNMENKATEIIQQLHMLSQIIYKEYFKIRKPASLMTNNPTSLCFLFSLNIRYEPSREMKSQWTAVWVKISSSWIGIVLYVWTLVAPLVLTNRDFD
ncbi:hypothetical protein M91_07312, partial [Bos mutus]